MKTQVIIQVFRTCTDTRISGKGLPTGMKAFIEGSGYKNGYKIYMDNNTRSCQCYIKIKGKKYHLINDLSFGFFSPYRLINLVGWYIEK
jgi:hypothetical protein